MKMAFKVLMPPKEAAKSTHQKHLQQKVALQTQAWWQPCGQGT
jgi:hypothetical protein